jgi:hypothetical protein
MVHPADVPFERMRAMLRLQLPGWLAVSDRRTQYHFDEDSAAFAEVDIRNGEEFVVAVVRGTLPQDEVIIQIWHRHAAEVWLVDPTEQTVTRAPSDEPSRELGGGETLRSPLTPGVAIPVAALFVSH